MKRLNKIWASAAVSAALVGGGVVAAQPASANVATFLSIGNAHFLVQYYHLRDRRVRVCIKNTSPFRAQIIKNRIKDLSTGAINRMGGGFVGPWQSYCATSAVHFRYGTTVGTIRGVRWREGHHVTSGNLAVSID